jgi:hypothetical protein
LERKARFPALRAGNAPEFFPGGIIY